eukprot:7593635-Lingulodinium_polyedra.AAC.1
MLASVYPGAARTARILDGGLPSGAAATESGGTCGRGGRSWCRAGGGTCNRGAMVALRPVRAQL